VVQACVVQACFPHIGFCVAWGLRFATVSPSPSVETTGVGNSIAMIDLVEFVAATLDLMEKLGGQSGVPLPYLRSPKTCQGRTDTKNRMTICLPDPPPDDTQDFAQTCYRSSPPHQGVVKGARYHGCAASLQERSNDSRVAQCFRQAPMLAPNQLPSVLGSILLSQL
jgi:hypothetical protein